MAFTYKGKLFRVKIGTKNIMHEISFDFGADTDFLEMADKDTENSFEPAKKSFTLNGEANVNNTTGDAEQDLHAMATWHAGQTKQAFTIGDGVTGNVLFSGEAYLKSYNFKGDNNNVMSYSWALQVEGEPTVAKTA